MKHIVMFSGGVGSWMAAKRVAAKYGTDDMLLLFADTRMEDEDLYRFVMEASVNVGAPLVYLADGRTPWQVFKDMRFLGNSRKDPCSKILKRKLMWNWVSEHCDHSETVIYFGIDWTEEHRLEGVRKRQPRWRCEAPLCESPYVTKPVGMLAALREEGIRPPRLYLMGYPHNNCGGFCVKAGQAQFRLLLQTQPERYAYHEEQEELLRNHLGKNISVMRDRRGGSSKPLTMREFRERIEANPKDCDMFEWGGCGCALE